MNGGELFADDRENPFTLEFGSLTFGKVIEDEECRADIGLVGLQHGGITRDGKGVGDAGYFTRHGIHFTHHGIRALEGRSVRQLHQHDGIAHVLGRNEAGRHILEQLACESDQCGVTDEHQHGQTDEFANQPGIQIGAKLEHAVEAPEEPSKQEVQDTAEPVRRRTVRLQQDGAERGTEGQ